MKTLNRQLDHAERVARGNSRPSRKAKVVAARKRVETYGDKQARRTENAVKYTLSLGEAFINYQRDEARIDF